jgi:hypothetical protein
MNRTICLLPGGYVGEDDVVHRQAELIPFTGQEEELLNSSGELVNARLVTRVLSRCVCRIGDIEPVTEEIARNLLVGDRQYLLLKLREVTFGDGVQDAVNCPWPDCGKKVDIDFSLKDIPVKELENRVLYHSLRLSLQAAFIDEKGEKHRKIIFRLPNGRDQEVLSSLLVENEAMALTKLLERCIQKIGPFKNLGTKFIHKLNPRARLEIEKHMEKIAPQVELTMDAHCPECGRKFELPFNLQDFFFGELQINQDLLYREVHYLAYHYHWSEGEILQMPRDKRRKYIEILADEIEQLNNAIG